MTKEFTAVLVIFGRSRRYKEAKRIKDDGTLEAESQRLYIYVCLYIRPS